MTRRDKLDELKEAGYQACIHGEPCIAPAKRELDRAAWEIGWRAARNLGYPRVSPIADDTVRLVNAVINGDTK